MRLGLAGRALGAWSRSVGESANLILHSGRSYGSDTPWQRHDHARHPSGNLAMRPLDILESELLQLLGKAASQDLFSREFLATLVTMLNARLGDK